MRKILENDGLRFDCRSEAELWRARTLLTKEPGTIAWLNEQLKPGDVFYDIGANVGCYTLYAARLVGSSGRVCAFEPHPANAAALLRNIAANPALVNRVFVITIPLGERSGYTSLSLGSLEAGSSGTTTAAIGDIMTAISCVDLLKLPPANVVKIDVDGNELNILRGMSNTLTHLDKESPRSIQVESPPSLRSRIEEFMAYVGYTKTGAHYTKACQQQLQAGVPASEVIENAIFQRAA